MAVFLADNFTGTNGTALSSHNADTGGAGWTKHPASGDNAAIQSNQASATGAEADYYHTATPGSANYFVQADLVCQTTPTSYAGVMLRTDTAATTWYGAGYDQGNARWELFRGSAGSFTTLGTSAATFSSGTRTIKLTVSGTGATVSLELFVGGVSTITASDTNASRITATGKAGLYTACNVSANNGYSVDTLSADDGTGAAATTLPVRNRRPTRVWTRRIYA